MGLNICKLPILFCILCLPYFSQQSMFKAIVTAHTYRDSNGNCDTQSYSHQIRMEESGCYPHNHLKCIGTINHLSDGCHIHYFHHPGCRGRASLEDSIKSIELACSNVYVRSQPEYPGIGFRFPLLKILQRRYYRRHQKERVGYRRHQTANDRSYMPSWHWY